MAVALDQLEDLFFERLGHGFGKNVFWCVCVIIFLCEAVDRDLGRSDGRFHSIIIRVDRFPS